jgi:hypothetical protein
MKRVVLAASAAVSTVLLAAGTARADDFGKAGEVSIGSDMNLAATGTLMTIVGGNASISGLLTPATMLNIGGASISNNGGSQFGFTLAPAADYFVIDNLSLGLEVLFGYATFSPPSPPAPLAAPPSTNVTMYGLTPRIGYNIPIGNSLSFWPKAFFEYAGYSIGGGVPGSGGYGNIQFFGAYAPILYHPVPHFYVGLGPNVLFELGESTNGQSATDKITSYGVFASIGGWFKMGD